MLLKDQLQDIIDSLGAFGPELALTIAFCGLLIAELLLLRQRPRVARQWLAGLTVISLVVVGALTLWTQVRGFLFLHLFFLDNQAVFFKLVVVLAAILVVVYEITSPPVPFLQKERGVLPPEWYALLLALVLGLFLLTMSVNMLAIYLSLELVSICSYMLTALSKTRKAAEGGIKYLLFGAVSSAIMLYGMSLLYGITGTLDLTSTVFSVELAKNSPLVVSTAGLLTLAGLLFKLSLVPFHVWTPDAYDAAPVPVAAFFSVAPKAATILVLMRFATALPEAELGYAIQIPLAIVALASITIGNFSALWQTDAKRLLAYSTIAQAGFLLVGVVALNEAGFEASTFYVGTYLVINLAAFFLVDLLSHVQRDTHVLSGTDSADTTSPYAISNFAGLGAHYPLLSIALTVVMIALVGLPPTVGFTAKLLVFSALYNAYQATGNGWLLALFGWGLLNAVISLVYYLKIPFLLFFRPSRSKMVAMPQSTVTVGLAVVLAVLSIWLFLKPDGLLSWIAEF